METVDFYYTVDGEAMEETKIKGSRFIGRVYACASDTGVEEILNDLRKKYYDATHHCFAYRVGLGKDIKFRYSDDGEPSGTAGKPIYDRILGNDLTNVLLVVTRYYGGTKLGTGGLTHAYSDSAGAVIAKAGITKKFITDRLNLIAHFSDYNNIERLVRQYEGRVEDSAFADVVTMTVELRLSFIEPFKEKLIDITSGRIKINAPL